MAGAMASELPPNIGQLPSEIKHIPTHSKDLSSGKIGRENIIGSLPSSSTVFKEHETVKAGYVEKRYRTRKSWKTRWLVLRHHFLSVYKNEKEYELLYCIDLYNTSAISEVEKKKPKHVFGICIPEKLFYFKCLSDNDRADWLRVLRNARDSDPIVPFEKLAQASQSGPPADTDISWDCNHISSGSYSSHNSDAPNSPHPADVLSDSSDDNSPSDHLIQPFDFVPTSVTDPEVMDNISGQSVPPAFGSQVFMQGVLFKHCVGYKAWRSRWFVLRDFQLSYYKNDKEYVLQGMVPRSDILDVRLATSSSKSKVFCFKVTTKQRAYKLAAPTSEERDAWIKALHNSS